MMVVLDLWPVVVQESGLLANTVDHGQGGGALGGSL